MPIIDHFGLLAPLYETFIPPKNTEELSNLAGLPTSGALLDAGGGLNKNIESFKPASKYNK